MTITKYTKDFIDNLVDYYISEAPSYRQIAEAYAPEINSVPDAAFGIITGCVYSAFLRAYENENKTVEARRHSGIQQDSQRKGTPDKKGNT
ncbi:hypothetical protein QVH35_11005 [Candidatus Nitrosotenuis chungbukensis]|uniref:hypothetical protein n=1 Tax=Candidatus Nitrosotenuis chungbukensis TaxID=1353246 RepID=UPI0026711016|nr:hypothetical protein [Candidatus Nitrosotenuis chungbukensis]WKT57812.1 hypothetical protein QVH35_11005 [Candidatus Nitrosotenuis chungbukensis]